MFKRLSLLLFYKLLVLSTRRCVPAHAVVSVQEQQFYKVSDLHLGIQAIGDRFPASSVLTCAFYCRSRYSASCESFIYDTLTRECLPGGELGSAETNAQAGQLIYSVWTTMCDRSQTYNFTLLRQFGVCVFLSSIQRNFVTAESDCNGINGRLITVKTLAKKNLLLSCSKILGTDYIWVGLSGNVTANDFHWSDGSAITSDERSIVFQQGYPQYQFGDENCCFFSAVSPTPGVRNEFCYKSKFFVCEYSY